MLADKYGPEKIMLTSFTKAAAEELAARINMEESDIIGTLHSICYKALKFPNLTETNLKLWNKQNPAYFLSDKAKDPGPHCLSKYQMFRNKLIPRDSWPKEITAFARVWDEWKQDNNLLDFMDLIEEAGGLFSPPGNPAVIVIDEAQDFSRLEMVTLRRWATQISELWVTGDPDQAIFSFTGADPRNMLEPPLPQEQKIILGQSYRIPASVHKVAEKIIKRVKVREDVTYLPRTEPGSVKYSSETLKDNSWVIKKALSLPGTSMILTSCNYMLTNLISDLKARGVAFANPWKPEEKSWNPLNNKTTQMLLNFIDQGPEPPAWSSEQFVSWAEHIKVGPEGLIRVKGKAGIEQIKRLLEDDPAAPGLHTCEGYIDQLMTPEAINFAVDRDLDWLLRNIAKAKIAPLRYPIKLYNQGGIDALKQKARIFVGTIHSVKGAEADNVFLYPDLSYAAVQEAQTKEGYENLCRLFYVGVTRAKTNLFLMTSSVKERFEI